MKKCKLLIILLVLFSAVILTSCQDGPYPYEEGYEKIHKFIFDMPYERIVEIMGEPNESVLEGYSSSLDKYFKTLYWFIGASSREEALESVKNGIPVRYYMVIVRSDQAEGAPWYFTDNLDKQTGYWNYE